MTTTPERRTATLSELVAEEIRAWLGRRRMSQAQLARAVGQSSMWVSDRLRGVQPINLDDIQKFARALEVEPYDLLPGREVATQAAHPRLTARYLSVAVRSAIPDRPRDNRPIGRPSAELTPTGGRTAYLDRARPRRRDR